jgi:hypothetical protein
VPLTQSHDFYLCSEMLRQPLSMKNVLNENVEGRREDRVCKVSEAACLSTRSAQLHSICFSPCEELSEEQKG